MAQLVNVRVELEPQQVGRGAADALVEHGTALSLLALLVEHDSVRPGTQVRELRGQSPPRPWRQVLPQGEGRLHRGVHSGFAPFPIDGAGVVDAATARRRNHLAPGPRVRADDAERARGPA